MTTQYPRNDTISVFVLAGDSYVTNGIFCRGERAASRLLHGFGVGVNELFDAM